METTPTKAGGAMRILLVDDDVAFSAFFKDFLLTQRPGGWIVHTADHYAPALTCLKENPIDLIVLDLNMPVMDGLQLLTLIKRTHPAIPVVMLTGMAKPENRAAGLKNGAALFFDKTEVAGDLKKIYAALENLAATPKQGFHGMLQQVGLPDVLQMECLNRRSCVLEVAAGKDTGRIYIQDGSIIHAESRNRHGEPALFHLLGLSGGEFRLKPFTRPPRHTIDGHWESLLMEAARLHDEAAGTRPAPTPAQPEPPAATARQIEEIVLCSGTGELLHEWKPKNVERRVRLLDALVGIAGSLAKNPLLARGDRLEVESPQSRTVLLLQPARRLLIQSAPKK